MINSVNLSLLAEFEESEQVWIHIIPFCDEKDREGQIKLYYSLFEHDWEFSTIYHDDYSRIFKSNLEKDKKMIEQLYQHPSFHDFLFYRKEIYDYLESIMFLDTVDVDSVYIEKSNETTQILLFKIQDIPLSWRAVFNNVSPISDWELSLLEIRNGSELFSNLKGMFLFEEKLVSSLIGFFD